MSLQVLRHKCGQRTCDCFRICLALGLSLNCAEDDGGGGAVDDGAKERDVVERGGRRRLTLAERGSRWGGCDPPLPKTLTCYAMLCNILHKTAI